MATTRTNATIRASEGPISAEKTRAGRSGTADHAATAVLQVAERLYRMNSLEWIVFFREVLGVDGIVRRTFDDPASLIRFECSPHYARIREMLDDLRSRQPAEPDRTTDRSALRVVTVRMPRVLHETLKAEAGDMRVSINTLCISKLLKLLDAEGRVDLESIRSSRLGGADSADDESAADPSMGATNTSKKGSKKGS